MSLQSSIKLLVTFKNYVLIHQAFETKGVQNFRFALLVLRIANRWSCNKNNRLDKNIILYIIYYKPPLRDYKNC